MNNQVVFNALKAQLESKKLELANYENDVYNPQVREINDQIVEWLQLNVQPILPEIWAEKYSIRIGSFSGKSSFGYGIEFSIDNYWVKDEKKMYVRMRTNSYSIQSDEENSILDMQLIGNMAKNFHRIEDNLLNVWSPMFKKAYENVEKMHAEIYELEGSVRSIQNTIDAEIRETYKKVGFECTLNNKKNLQRNYDSDAREMFIEENVHSINLFYGRSRFDYVYISYFKVKAINKYKCTIEYKNGNSENTDIRSIEVSRKRFDDFIDSVYDWQTSGSERYNKDVERRFEAYYSK